MRLRPNRFSVRVGGRLLVAGCLVLALMPPLLPWSRAALDVTVVVDESKSMPVGFADNFWAQLPAILGRGQSDARLHLIRFAEQPVLEPAVTTATSQLGQAMPRSIAIDGSRTDIASALREALRLGEPNRAGVILLVSDAAANEGDTGSVLESASVAGVPVYLVNPQQSGVTETLRLLDLQVSSQVSVGEEVTVRARFSSASGTEVSLALAVDEEIRDSKGFKLAPDTQGNILFRYVPRHPGVNKVAVKVTGSSGGIQPAILGKQTRAVTVVGPPSILYVTSRTDPSPWVAMLRSAGWDVLLLTPSDLITQESALDNSGIAVLDDLGIGELPEKTWQALTRSVKGDGTGLLVLGGTHSFGAGGYRHSTLENILPVTAEAAEPQKPASVLFLLDVSGSMGRAQAGPSRFELAQRAVEASVKMLLPGDQVGVITFAGESEVRFPLSPRETVDGNIARVLDLKPSGGTVLTPALLLAAEELAASAPGQRLVVLVTDGFSQEEDLKSVAQKLESYSITVIALAVGDDARQETLTQLTGFNEGRVLPVTRIATLPRFMSSAVASSRAPGVAEPTRVLPAQPLPFKMNPLATAWPSLAGYMVSKPRPEADVYLRSERGDPLFAARMAGAGRVAVLPAGFLGWADAWWTWPHFNAFSQGALRWLDGGQVTGDLSLSIQDKPGQLVFVVDAFERDEWDSDQELELLVDDPRGARTKLPMVLEAPGRYGAELPAFYTGLYRVHLRGEKHRLSQAVYRNSAREFTEPERMREQLRTWTTRGWLKPWPGVEELSRVWPRDSSGLRKLFLLLSIFSYLLVLMYERGLIDALLARVRSWFAA